MNLKELKEKVDSAVERAIEYGEKPEDILVSLQIDDEADPHHGSVCTDEDVELTYDGNAMASGCVLSGWRDSANKWSSGGEAVR